MRGCARTGRSTRATPASRWLAAGLVAAAVSGAWAGAGSGARPATPRPGSAATSPGACPADPAWVESPGQPDFNLNPTVLCAFYQYSWRSFLYLTSPSGGPGSPLRFETWPSVDDVFGTPRLAGGARLFTAVDARHKKKRFFRPRVNKPGPAVATTGRLSFDETTQAGSAGILVDQRRNVTYYEQLLDPGVAVPFIERCSLKLRDCWTQPGAQDLRFPNGSIEVKAAWRPMWKGDPNVGDFYTIPGFEVENASGKRVTPDFMALVGLHLVYSAQNHPEMVWATFEHAANAPAGPCLPGRPTCGQLPAGFDGWSYNDCRSTSCASVNRWPFPPSPAPSPPYPVAQAFREWAYGTDPELVDGNKNPGATNVAILEALNRSVQAILPRASVWGRYFLSGAVWTSGGRLPALAPYLSNGQPNPGVNQVGSTFLANSTMETFTQLPDPAPSPFPSPAPVQSCFTCHNTAGSTLASPPPAQNPPFRVSHAFGAAPNPSPAPACPWTASPPKACLDTQAPAGRSSPAAGVAAVPERGSTR